MHNITEVLSIRFFSNILYSVVSSSPKPQMWLTFLDTGLAAADLTTFLTVLYAAVLALNVSSMPHAMNALVYFWRVPHFRRSVIRLVTCCALGTDSGRAKKSATSSQSQSMLD